MPKAQSHCTVIDNTAAVFGYIILDNGIFIDRYGASSDKQSAAVVGCIAGNNATFQYQSAVYIGAAAVRCKTAGNQSECSVLESFIVSFEPLLT